MTLVGWQKITVRVRDGKKLAHEGIKVEFVGSIGELLQSVYCNVWLRDLQ